MALLPKGLGLDVIPSEAICHSGNPRGKGNDLIAASIHDEYDFGVSEDRNRTVVYLEFIYTRRIDKKKMPK